MNPLIHSEEDKANFENLILIETLKFSLNLKVLTVSFVFVALFKLACSLAYAMQFNLNFKKGKKVLLVV